MKLQIVITEKNVYGNILLYPACETAMKFAKLLGKKTFSNYDLCNIEALGYIIVNASEIGKQMTSFL